uniref:Uncharacterized protein n=1 Tax=Trepomonas sp. PC1 TaxID=1076344 RepID=A0A146K3H9_9EUKA|eukprot:JAP90445.1 Hypothetical protein TPC1_30060 [Trepomonas sp. PC1]
MTESDLLKSLHKIAEKFYFDTENEPVVDQLNGLLDEQQQTIEQQEQDYLEINKICKDILKALKIENSSKNTNLSTRIVENMNVVKSQLELISIDSLKNQLKEANEVSQELQNQIINLQNSLIQQKEINLQNSSNDFDKEDYKQKYEEIVDILAIAQQGAIEDESKLLGLQNECQTLQKQVQELSEQLLIEKEISSQFKQRCMETDNDQLKTSLQQQLQQSQLLKNENQNLQSQVETLNLKLNQTALMSQQQQQQLEKQLQANEQSQLKIVSLLKELSLLKDVQAPQVQTEPNQSELVASLKQKLSLAESQVNSLNLQKIENDYLKQQIKNIKESQEVQNSITDNFNQQVEENARKVSSLNKQLLMKDEELKKAQQAAEYEKILKSQAEERLLKYKKEDLQSLQQMDKSLFQHQTSQQLTNQLIDAKLQNDDLKLKNDLHQKHIQKLQQANDQLQTQISILQTEKTQLQTQIDMMQKNLQAEKQVNQNYFTQFELLQQKYDENVLDLTRNVQVQQNVLKERNQLESLVEQQIQTISALEAEIGAQSSKSEEIEQEIDFLYSTFLQLEVSHTEGSKLQQINAGLKELTQSSQLVKTQKMQLNKLERELQEANKRIQTSHRIVQQQNEVKVTDLQQLVKAKQNQIDFLNLQQKDLTKKINQLQEQNILVEEQLISQDAELKLKNELTESYKAKSEELGQKLDLVQKEFQEQKEVIEELQQMLGNELAKECKSLIKTKQQLQIDLYQQQQQLTELQQKFKLQEDQVKAEKQLLKTEAEQQQQQLFEQLQQKEKEFGQVQLNAQIQAQELQMYKQELVKTETQATLQEKEIQELTALLQSQQTEINFLKQENLCQVEELSAKKDDLESSQINLKITTKNSLLENNQLQITLEDQTKSINEKQDLILQLQSELLEKEQIYAQQSKMLTNLKEKQFLYEQDKIQLQKKLETAQNSEIALQKTVNELKKEISALKIEMSKMQLEICLQKDKTKSVELILAQNDEMARSKRNFSEAESKKLEQSLVLKTSQVEQIQDLKIENTGLKQQLQEKEQRLKEYQAKFDEKVGKIKMIKEVLQAQEQKK